MKVKIKILAIVITVILSSLLITSICFDVYYKNLIPQLKQSIDEGDFHIKYLTSSYDNTMIHNLNADGLLSVNSTIANKEIFYEVTYSPEVVKLWMKEVLNEEFYRFSKFKDSKRHSDHDDSFPSYEYFVLTLKGKDYKFSASKLNHSITTYRENFYPRTMDIEHQTVSNRKDPEYEGSTLINDDIKIKLKYKRIFQDNESPNFIFSYNLDTLPDNISYGKVQFLAGEEIDFISESEVYINDFENSINKEIKVEFKTLKEDYYGPIYSHVLFYDSEDQIVSENYNYLYCIKVNGKTVLNYTYDKSLYTENLPSYNSKSIKEKQTLEVYYEKDKATEEIGGLISKEMYEYKSVIQFNGVYSRSSISQYYNEDNWDKILICIDDSKVQNYRLELLSTGENNLILTNYGESVHKGINNYFYDLELAENYPIIEEGYVKVLLTTLDEDNAPINSRFIIVDYDYGNYGNGVFSQLRLNFPYPKDSIHEEYIKYLTFIKTNKQKN